ATPAAIDTVRRDLPPGLAPVVQRLMAKNPRDRYQTPAEVADALAPFSPGAADRTGNGISTLTFPHAAAETGRLLTGAEQSRFAAVWWLLGAAALVLLGGLAALLLIIATREPGPGGDAKVEVLVQLAGIAKPADPKTIVILLDGRAIPFEDLEKEIKL